MRIALVSMHTSPTDLPGSGDAGGMNVVERAQAEALGRAGHTVELITRRADPDVPGVVELGPGVTLRHLTAGPQRPVAKSAQEELIGAFAEQFAALAEGPGAGAERPGSDLSPYDIVHSHHWMSGVAALPAARAWGVPHVQSFHSVAAPPGTPLAEGERAESPGRIAGEARLAQNSDLVVAISAYEASVAVGRCGAAPDRVVEVPPGVDRTLFRPLRPDDPTPGYGADRGYLVFAARLQPLKGADLAVRALGLVEPGLRPHLVIAGEVSADFADYRAELDRFIAEAGLGDQVTFLGPQDRTELAALFRSARAVLVPSHSETFGLVALEASASGVPVVASDAGGLAEAVLDHVTGRLVRSREPEAWAAALTDLLADPARADAMGRAGRRRAEGFDWDDVARRLAGLYEGLLPVSV